MRLLVYNANRAQLVTERHALELVEQLTPVVSEELRVLGSLLRPILVPAGNVVLAGLEVNELIPDALLDEDGPVVLVDDGLFVLYDVSED